MSATDHVSPDRSDIVDFCGEYAVVRKRNGKLQLYADITTYASNKGGQCIQTGKVVRDYSPTADEREGKAAQFSTVAEAEAYIKAWLTPPARKAR